MALDATVGGLTANSYVTVVEATAYWENRPYPEAWTENTQSQEGLLMTATRMIDMLRTPYRRLIRDKNGKQYYILRPVWLGAPTTTTQALAWPRTGMVNRNGAAIPSDEIPQDLKDATSELAGQLSKSDRLIDSDIVAQGISSVRAGSVSVSFRDDIQLSRYFSDIIDMFLALWSTEEIIESANRFEFEVL